MFGKKKSQDASANQLAATGQPRDFLLEAEKILQHPDMLSMSVGIRPTPQPLRTMLDADDADLVNDGLNALAALLQGPNGRYRQIAAFAFGQAGVDSDELLKYLRERGRLDPAPDVKRALSAAIMALEAIPGRTDTSELARRWKMQRHYYGG